MKPGTILIDTRPLQYGKEYTVSHRSKDESLKDWYVMTNGKVLHESHFKLKQI